MLPTIKLVRHGESEANTNHRDPLDVGDPNISLTARGRTQAVDAGRTLGSVMFERSLIYTSPYRRTRQTLDGILEGAGIDEARRKSLAIYEDPRLREVEHGYYDVEDQAELRQTHGWFYYRFRGGESPADCFDRTSSFLESLMRQIERKNAEHALVVSHGLTIRCFVMRFLHLSVDQFDSMANPGNCDIITIGSAESLADRDVLFSNGRWSVAGLRGRDD